jgi:hypothetical protein
MRILAAITVAALICVAIMAADNSAAYEQCRKQHSNQVCINILR